VADSRTAAHRPHTATIPARGPPGGRVASANAVTLERRRSIEAQKRVCRIMVQAVGVATTSFAFLDLYLLLTHSRH